MQASTISPVTNLTTAVTKSREQILIQSSGAMIAVIVIGIIFILGILLIILKAYNKKMHTRRILGGTSSKPRKTTSTTTMTTLPMEHLHGSARLGGFANLPSNSENGFRLPRAELANTAERVSMNSGSTVATIHNVPTIGNT
ncbi:hypothetical protein KOW79_008533 [Hemibagrus wyckioides]|uniref:Noncompact myelin-associated protein n=1 Tax=Hemibagrus wyckioides TaxID=337641 RepID=A0A9D3NUN7_9TELE|nr:noncompact myelin-associated protein [Hemibagrus wyckioides]XP_058255196.1 noncompact myelin-associated protein [Hemibagrus wyckioides]KAG7328589.1 hypothetical protein KOW79_008533 [Hemibagrus wyckioides]